MNIEQRFSIIQTHRHSAHTQRRYALADISHSGQRILMWAPCFSKKDEDHKNNIQPAFGVNFDGSQIRSTTVAL
ncbi:hypothetical protein [Ferrimonas lipolytica]|uniref:Uncharacterized protein n=1 Tax=Ferrimonas lipolytica TaxID=2724191 RepID=A0A6H1UB93_9GAMM|nr:hypothetical protein [Ferrimonas lipolytica]QIZ76108.1 hypothetical protein HER31_03905 [Ferrimonas lipolytica]